MRSVAFPAAALLAVAACLAAPAPRAGEDGEPPLKLSDWQLERSRYGQGDKIPKKVEAKITVTNTGKESMGKVRSQLLYYASTGEKVKETTWQFAVVIAPGRSHTFTYVEGLVPAFEGYEMLFRCEVGGQDFSWTFRSPDPMSLPTFWNDKPIKGTSRLMIVGREVIQDSRTKGHKLYLRVRNLGDQPAAGAAVTVEFLDQKGGVAAKWDKKLGDGTVAGGLEQTFEYPIDIQVPGHAAYRVKLSAAQKSDEEMLAGGEFTKSTEIELAHFKFARRPGGILEISAEVRNGKQTPVPSPTVVLQLIDKSTPPKTVKRVPFEVPGPLAPGAIRPVTVSVPDCPPFSGYSYEVEYSEKTEPTFKPVAAEVAAGKAGVSRVEISSGPGGELVLTATVQNRAAYEVAELKVEFQLLGGPGGEVVGRCAGGLDKLAAGATGTLRAELAKPPKFANFTWKVNYREPTPPPALQDRTVPPGTGR